jgi:hypothetical protein
MVTTHVKNAPKVSFGCISLGLEQRIQPIDKEHSDAGRDTKGYGVSSYLPKVRTALRRRAQGNPWG